MRSIESRSMGSKPIILLTPQTPELLLLHLKSLFCLFAPFLFLTLQMQGGPDCSCPSPLKPHPLPSLQSPSLGRNCKPPGVRLGPSICHVFGQITGCIV